MKISYLIFMSFLVIGCDAEQLGTKVSNRNPPPPTNPTAAEYCESLKISTRADLNKTGIELVTNEFPHGVENAIRKRILFQKILKDKFKMTLTPVFDSVFYPDCVTAIMDSAIASKYGPNGKDSIIELVNIMLYKKYKDQ